MYVDDLMHIVDQNVQSHDAHVCKKKIHRLIIYIDFFVNIQIRSNVFLLIVRQMKIKIEKIVRCLHFEITSRFLYYHDVVICDLFVCQQRNHDFLFYMSNVVLQN